MEDLLDQAQQEFVAADAALEDGDLAGYQEHIQKARDLVAQALDAEGGGSSSPSASGSPSPKPSASEPSASP